MALPLRDNLSTRRFPWVTVTLIAINVIVFLFLQPSAFQNPPDQKHYDASEAQRGIDGTVYSLRWGAIPCELLSGRQAADHPSQCGTDPEPFPTDKVVYVTLLTAMFLHGSVAHIAGNMLFLWVFGNNVEDRLGRAKYLALYLAGGMAATMGFAAVHPHTTVPLIGASGAIAAAMGAYLALFPRGRILTAVATAAFQVVYIPAVIVLMLFFVTQFLTPDSNVAWEAHVAGMLAGFAAALLLRRLPSVRYREHEEQLDLSLRGGAHF